jgi:hypothetical protein
MQSSKAATGLSILCLAIFCVLAAGSMDSGGSSSSSASSSAASSALSVDTTKDILKRDIKFTYTWSSDGMIMMINFKIDNPTDHAFKDFEISCDHFGPSGTKIDSNTRTIYEVVKAHGKKAKNQFNMGFIHSQAATSNCRISDLTPID